MLGSINSQDSHEYWERQESRTCLTVCERLTGSHDIVACQETTFTDVQRDSDWSRYWTRSLAPRPTYIDSDSELTETEHDVSPVEHDGTQVEPEAEMSPDSVNAIASRGTATLEPALSNGSEFAEHAPSQQSQGEVTNSAHGNDEALIVPPRMCESQSTGNTPSLKRKHATSFEENDECVDVLVPVMKSPVINWRKVTSDAQPNYVESMYHETGLSTLSYEGHFDECELLTAK